MPIGRDRTRRRPRVAVVLSGGGNLGAIQVGMLRALVESGVEPDVVIGCSVGALNGAAFAADPTPAGVRRLEAHWLATTSHTVMPASRLPNALQLLRKGESLYSNEGLRASYVEFLGPIDTFEELRVPFQCVATDVDAAMSRWFDSGPLIDPILASAALPAVYPPVVIDGRRHVDGGVVDNVPIARAVELGARRIYVLHVGPHGRPDAELRRPLDAALLAYWIARNHRFARDLAALPPGVEAVVLTPGDRPDLRYDDFSRSNELIELGYRRATEMLGAAVEEAAAPRRGPAALLEELVEPVQRLVLGARSRREAERASVRGGRVGDTVDAVGGVDGDVSPVGSGVGSEAGPAEVGSAEVGSAGVGSAAVVPEGKDLEGRGEGGPTQEG